LGEQLGDMPATPVSAVVFIGWRNCTAASRYFVATVWCDTIAAITQLKVPYASFKTGDNKILKKLGEETARSGDGFTG